MARTPPSPTALRVAELSQTAENAFALRPDAAAMQELASALGFTSLRKLSFQGRVLPLGQTDWELSGRLGATIVQACVITLEPVTTRIDMDVRRQFLAEFEDPEEPEAEMPENETAEALGSWIDPAVVMEEALALAAPDYPRQPDAALGSMAYTEPGQTPMTDDDAKPFAGLADLKAKLEKGDGES